MNQLKGMSTVLLIFWSCAVAVLAQDPVVAVDDALQKRSRPVLEEVVPGTLWVDAEDFSDYGGWYHDTQFIYLMGSGYLLAAGTGTPVEDAVTSVSLNASGSYTLWVRSRNWHPEHTPGTFKVQVDDALSESFGNAEHDEWGWQKGGTFALNAGEHTLRLVDETGFYGRCDALVLTSDDEFIPPGPEAVAEARAKYTGLDLRPAVYTGFDVIVVGGGPSGTSAAIAAARTGAKTALIQDRPVLGGNNSAEFAVRMNGAGAKNSHMREGGIINEAVLINADNGDANFSKAYHQLAAAASNLTVFLNTRVDGVLMASDDRIKGVKGVHALDGSRAEFYGKLFVDCTGDGWLGYYAGADFRVGREARSEFLEAPAPEMADHVTMSGTLQSQRYALKKSTPQKLSPVPWGIPLTSGIEKDRGISGVGTAWWMEYPGAVDDVWEGEYARDYLIRIAFGYFDYLKHSWTKKTLAQNYSLNHVGAFMGRRESRRLEGDYMLTLNDVLAGKWFDDSITTYGWSVDVHHPMGILSTEGPFDCNYHVKMGGGIPFRCLYSKNITNLFMAGRCISVSHYALGTTRIMMTCATTGQAAGTAAAMCAQRGISPRRFGRKSIPELQQQLVKDDQYIPRITNEDAKDLARSAICTASSVQEVWEVTRDYFLRPGTIDKDKKWAGLTSHQVMFPNGRLQAVGTLNFFITSKAKTERKAVLQISTAQEFRDFEHLTDLAEIPVTIPAGFDGVLPVTVNREVPGRFLVLKFEGDASGVYWQRSQSNPPMMCTRYKWRGEKFETKMIPAFYAEPALDWEYDFSAQNVVNGRTRCLLDGTVNMWSSDPQEMLPQWVQLTWPDPQEINEIQLVFDTNLDRYQYYSPVIPERIQDYEVQVWVPGGWKTVIRETGNIQRRRVHRFEMTKTDKMRVLVSKTGGDASARIYEVRAYRSAGAAPEKYSGRSENVAPIKDAPAGKTKEEYITWAKQASSRKGWVFNESKSGDKFNQMDVNADGILTKEEQRRYRKKK